MKADDQLFVGIPPHTIGDYSYVGEFTHISQNTTIGKYCSIANLCTIGAQAHYIGGLSTWPFPEIHALAKQANLPTTIGNDVWIGCNVVILSGLTIGDGAVIGAGSVVTHDVPPYGIAYGNPARVHRFRFDSATVADLLELKWWDCPPDVVHGLPHTDVRQAIANLKGQSVQGR